VSRRGCERSIRRRCAAASARASFEVVALDQKGALHELGSEPRKLGGIAGLQLDLEHVRSIGDPAVGARHDPVEADLDSCPVVCEIALPAALLDRHERPERLLPDDLDQSVSRRRRRPAGGIGRPQAEPVYSRAAAPGGDPRPRR